MIDFRRESVADLVARVSSRSISARELTQAALDRIAAVDGQVGAFVAVDGDRALEQAATIDQRTAHGHESGPLAGIPIGVKDLEDARGFRTTYGSVLHADDPPADRDSVLVARLRAAGCVVIGKTNTPEHGSRAVTENELFPPTRNPWSLDRSPGGSSGGSAAAIAAGMVPMATGSDGGGSIRIPSAVCGLTGLKPSLGRVPAGGPRPPGWPDLSTKGVMARTLRDVVAGLDVAVGPDPSDLRSLPPPELSWSRSLDDAHVPHRIGWAPTLGYATIDKEVLGGCERAVSLLADLGAEVVEIDDVFEQDPVFDWLAIAGTANERTIGHLRGTPDWARIDLEMRQYADVATERCSPADVIRGFDAMHTLNLRLVDVFHRVSLLLTPTVAGQTPRIGDGRGTVNGELTPSWVALTYPFNLTRSPAGTVCTGFTADGLPIGVQVVGPQHADVAVLRLLLVLEDALGLDTIAPLP
jgi:Asp-tRNA(Asn)/Glu-tRNA(Gln) amidotransferase A subunit family amidase